METAELTQTSEATVEKLEDEFNNFLTSLYEQFREFMKSKAGVSEPIKETLVDEGTDVEIFDTCDVESDSDNTEMSTGFPEEVPTCVGDTIVEDTYATEPFFESTPADIEIRVDEIYSIKVTASEAIQQLQADVYELQEKVNNMLTAEEVEQKITDAVSKLKLQFV